MAMLNDISIYIVGDCAQTLYEFRDADPRILNNLTKLFNTYDLSINHRSTQIILDVANLMSQTMSTHKTTLRSNNVINITQQAIDNAVTIDTYNKVTDAVTLLRLDNYIEKHIGNTNGETIAVIARSGQDVQKLYDYLQSKYGAKYNVQNITSQRRNDITILSAIGQSLTNILPKTLNSWQEFEKAITDENVRLNGLAKGGNRYNTNGPTVNKVTMEWLQKESANSTQILARLNNPNTRDEEIRDLNLSLLDSQTEKNNILQRVMDAKNAKLKNQKADIVVCTVHGVKGLEYDHVACFITTEAGRHYTSNSDENKRISYVALTRAKQTECVFCTREKLVKDFEAYRAAQPV
jgi:DNA helicase-2/ATP-dependent DNA helicase PcrA